MENKSCFQRIKLEVLFYILEGLINYPFFNLFQVRVFSGYIKDIEDKPSETPWGAKMPFAKVMAEFNNSENVIISVCFFTLMSGSCRLDSVSND